MNSLDNGNPAFKNVVWTRFWSWTSAIVLIFISDLHKFKLDTQLKTLTHAVNEREVGIKDAIEILLLSNASQKLLVSELLKFVKQILKVPATNAVSER